MANKILASYPGSISEARADGRLGPELEAAWHAARSTKAMADQALNNAEVLTPEAARELEARQRPVDLKTPN